MAEQQSYRDYSNWPVPPKTSRPASLPKQDATHNPSLGRDLDDGIWHQPCIDPHDWESLVLQQVGTGLSLWQHLLVLDAANHFYAGQVPYSLSARRLRKMGQGVSQHEITSYLRQMTESNWLTIHRSLRRYIVRPGPKLCNLANSCEMLI